jgi:hypothetical protein
MSRKPLTDEQKAARAAKQRERRAFAKAGKAIISTRADAAEVFNPDGEPAEPVVTPDVQARRDAWDAAKSEPELPKGRGKPNIKVTPELAEAAYQARQAGRTFPQIRDEVGFATADNARDAYIAGCYNRGEAPGIKHRSPVEAARYGGQLVTP